MLKRLVLLAATMQKSFHPICVIIKRIPFVNKESSHDFPTVWRYFPRHSMQSWQFLTRKLFVTFFPSSLICSSRFSSTTLWQPHSSTHRKYLWWLMSRLVTKTKWMPTSTPIHPRSCLTQCHWVSNSSQALLKPWSDATCVLGSTPFANYQPQKASAAAFELGITRTTPSPSSASSEENTFISNPESDGEDYLKPATDEESQRWSSEGTRGTDLLF